MKMETSVIPLTTEATMDLNISTEEMDYEEPTDDLTRTIDESIQQLHAAFVFFKENKHLFDDFAKAIATILKSKYDSSDDESETRTSENYNQRLKILRLKKRKLLNQLELYWDILIQFTNFSILLLDEELSTDTENEKGITYGITKDLCLMTRFMNEFVGKFNELINAFLELKCDVELNRFN